MALARDRNRVLREIASRKKVEFMQSLRGTKVEAITLQTGDANSTEALTDNYLKMRVSGRHAANRWLNVRVAGLAGEMLEGRWEPERAAVEPAPAPVTGSAPNYTNALTGNPLHA